MSKINLILYKTQEYEQQIQLRYDVLRAPLGLNFTEEYLQKDAADSMFGYFLDGQLQGCVQLTPLGHRKYQLRQMAVNPEMQGLHIGSQLIQYVEQYIKEKGGALILLHARKHAAGFYEKLGYEKIGDEFVEVGIPHIEMQKMIE